MELERNILQGVNKREHSKQSDVHKNRIELGLTHSAILYEPAIFYNWRKGGPDSEAHISPRDALFFSASTCWTDIFCSVLICKTSLELSSLRKDLPPCNSNPANNFNSGIDRLRWCGPALVSDMGSDPEG